MNEPKTREPKTLEQLDIELSAARTTMMNAVRDSSDMRYVHACLEAHKQASDAYFLEKCRGMMHRSPRAAPYIGQALAEGTA